MDMLDTLPALTRRNLLKTGGALVIGFSLAGRAAAQFGAPQGPNLRQIDSWIAIHADNTATVLIGYVELGQGCTTSLPPSLGGSCSRSRAATSCPALS